MEATRNPNKGFQMLVPEIQKLKKNPFAKDIEIIVFGSSEPQNPPNFGISTHYMGGLYDDIGSALPFEIQP